MKAALLKLWSSLAESFWFVPAGMSVLAFAGSAILIDLDRHGDWGSVAWLWSGGAAGARSLLSTVATSMMTVAGTVFSITIAALTLASQQFGPRLLRNFTVDRGNQIVLGTFVSTFLYCLMVLRAVRGQDEGQFVPNLSISAAVLLAVASLCVLIYFIHHLSVSIQAEGLVASVGRDLKADLRRLTPPASPDREEAVTVPAPPERRPQAVSARASGYLQTVDRDALVALAERHDLLLRLVLQPGDFVSTGETLLEMWAGDAEVPAGAAEALLGNIQLGRLRTPWQDGRYGVRQLTEIGARALSPAINGPFTAMGCLDWLTDALIDVAGRGMPPAASADKQGHVRLLESPVAFAELLALGIEPFRAYGADSVILTCHLLQSLARLGAQVSRPEHRRAVLQQARQVDRFAEQSLAAEDDRRRVHEGLAAVERALGGTASRAGEISRAHERSASDQPERQPT